MLWFSLFNQKMASNSYNEWISIYTNDLEKVWKEEGTPLRRASMIYHALEMEFERVKLEFCTNFDDIRNCLSNRASPFRSINKENISNMAKSPLREIKLSKMQIEPNAVESPDDLFGKDNKEERLKSPDSKRIITQMVTVPSPPICRSKYVAMKKSRAMAGSSMLYPTISYKVEKTPKVSQNVADEICRTPQSNKCDISDSAIIDQTPDVKPLKKQNGRSTTKCASRPKCQTSTLTQMFGSSTRKKKRKFDSNMGSLDIEEMLDIINDSSTEEELPGDADSKYSETVDNLSPICETEVDISQIPDDTEDNTAVGAIPQKRSYNGSVPASFIDNYNAIPEAKQNQYDHPVIEVVRGKERKMLKGWSCRECENFYKNMNLPPDELEKKMNECSRHKGRFQPRDETFTGFWDMTFGPTPKPHDTQDSMIFQYKK